MRRAYVRHACLALLALVIGGCGDGKAGGEGPYGWPAHCEALMEEGVWKVSCPDGSSAEIAPGGCEEVPGEGGTRIIRCADGSEAVVNPSETASFGAVRGRVVLSHLGSAAEVVVEVLGTDLATHCQPDGSFLLEGIPAGRYTIEASYGSYEPVRVEGVQILPGTVDLGTLRIDAYRTLDTTGHHLALNHEGQLLLVVDQEARVLDLVTGTWSAIEVPDGELVEYGVWLGPDTLLLNSRSESSKAVGVWSLGGGTTWLDDLTPTAFGTKGILGYLPNEAGEWIVWFLRHDQAVELAFPPNTGILALGWSGRSLAAHADGTFLVDVTSGTPEIRRLADGPRRDFYLDHTGKFVIFKATDGTTELFDLDRPELSIPMPSDISAVNFRGAIASWRTIDGTWSHYDADRSHTWVGVPGEGSAWSPLQRWIWSRGRDGSGRIEERDGSSSVSFDEWDELIFSPKETRVLVVGPGPAMTVLDLAGGERRTDLPPGLDSCDWVDEGHLFCDQGGEGVLVGIEGQISYLGKATAFQHEGRFLLQEPSGQWHVWREDTSTFRRIGSAAAVVPIPGRDGLLVVSEGGRLYHFTPETGEKVPMADEVIGAPFAMKDCLIFPALLEGQGTLLYATYPR